MIPMVAFLVDTDIAYDGIEESNFVHEWGVVILEENAPLLCGIPGWESSIDYFDDDMCAEAPVVWIHGEPFSGEFTVELPGNESFTFIYPNPDRSKENSISWQIRGGTGYEQSEEESLPMLQSLPFGWGVEHWRAVPSLILTQ